MEQGGHHNFASSAAAAFGEGNEFHQLAIALYAIYCAKQELDRAPSARSSLNISKLQDNTLKYVRETSRAILKRSGGARPRPGWGAGCDERFARIAARTFGKGTALYKLTVALHNFARAKWQFDQVVAELGVEAAQRSNAYAVADCAAAAAVGCVHEISDSLPLEGSGSARPSGFEADLQDVAGLLADLGW